MTIRWVEPTDITPDEEKYTNLDMSKIFNAKIETAAPASGLVIVVIDYFNALD